MSENLPFSLECLLLAVWMSSWVKFEKGYWAVQKQFASFFHFLFFSFVLIFLDFFCLSIPKKFFLPLILRKKRENYIKVKRRLRIKARGLCWWYTFKYLQSLGLMSYSCNLTLCLVPIRATISNESGKKRNGKIQLPFLLFFLFCGTTSLQMMSLWQI